MQTSQPQGPEPAAGRPAHWLGGGLLVFLLALAWALAVPLMASPDEPSHVVKAAAVARGQLSGSLGAGPADASRPGAGTMVELPSDYAAVVALPNCFAYQADVPAACQQDVAPPGTSDVPVETFAGQYPPLYYLLVGWPSRFLAAEASVYAMRIVSAALTTALLVWGTYRMVRSVGRAAAVLAVGLAVTPMCLFLGATVNPQGLEVAAAFSLWASAIALAIGRGRASTATVLQAAVSGAILVNVRTSSPFWAVAIVVVALVLAPPGRWRELVRHPAARGVLALTALASATAVGWVLTHRAVVTGDGLFPQYADPRLTVLSLTGHTYEYVLNMIGNFGWLDAPSPPATFVAWFAVGGALVLLGLAAHTSRREKAALALLVGGVGLVPFVLQLPTAVDTGIIWQGRYALPVAVGVPMVAAVLLRSQAYLVGDLVRRVSRLSVPALLIAHVAAFWWASRRYAEGLNGELFAVVPDWSSPIGYLPGVVAYAVIASALAWAAWHATRPPMLDGVPAGAA